MTAAIYARYSSDLQNARSIDDQVAACQAFAARIGQPGPFPVYADQALSGASMATRPSLQRLLVDVRARRVTVVLSEALDRLSRDQADIALIHRAVKFADGKIITISEGEVDAMHIGLKGTMNHLFLEELARKTRRGMMGAVREGRVPGSCPYGYRTVLGQPGVRTIDADEAAIVVRVFKEYARGDSPIAIVGRLNKEGVLPPRVTWRSATLLGNPNLNDGLLAQELYRGRIVFNRRRVIKDPDTGRRAWLLNPASEWVVAPAEHLRIIEDDLWEAVQIQRARISRTPILAKRRRPKRLLSGLIRCGACRGAVNIVGSTHFGCQNARYARTCGELRTIAAKRITARVLASLKSHLLAPQAIAAAVKAYHEELRDVRKGEARQRADLERDLAGARRRADRIADRLIESGGPVLQAKLAEAEADIARVESALALLGEPPKIELHPQAAQRYRERVTMLESVVDVTGSPEAAQFIRALIDHVDLTRDEAARDGWRITVHGQLAAIVAAAQPGSSVSLGVGPYLVK
ncbi:MAG: recombinase family protein [Hyphomonadaceae bacterium]